VGFRLLPKPLHPDELLQEIEALAAECSECADKVKFGAPCERIIEPRPV
jgi:hypothetical protein